MIELKKTTKNKWEAEDLEFAKAFALIKLER